MTVPRLLLISSSVVHGSGYLDHCAAEIRDLLGDDVDRVLFVPFALHDRDAYAAKARERFAALGYGLDSLHEAADPVAGVGDAQAMFIGGGNTFRLLSTLYERDVVEPIRRRVAAGMPYIGTSAGSNVACPTIRTSNDMPIVEPPSFAALGLVGFQINPHYLDPDPTSKHQGETREQRLREYHEDNELPVVGLREGAMLRVEGAAVELRGSAGARLFRRGRPPEELLPLSRLERFLLA
ncbi:MAG TPA: dipeptidase PepE [Thermoanaerobaculia bacterium]|nr:dipeptidase PepE [Thermoanaerobaculia bacterium]